MNTTEIALRHLQDKAVPLKVRAMAVCDLAASQADPDVRKVVVERMTDEDEDPRIVEMILAMVTRSTMTAWAEVQDAFLHLLRSSINSGVLRNTLEAVAPLAPHNQWVREEVVLLARHHEVSVAVLAVQIVAALAKTHVIAAETLQAVAARPYPEVRAAVAVAIMPMLGVWAWVGPVLQKMAKQETGMIREAALRDRIAARLRETP